MNTNFAYLSGYIDGDGCFYIGKNIHPIKYRSGIIISSTQMDVLRFFKKTFGGSLRFGKKNPKFKTYNVVNQWIIGGINSTELAIKIFPYLIEKSNDAHLYIKFRNEKIAYQKDNFISQTKIYRDTQNLVTKEIVNDIKNISIKISPTEEDFAYLAGFIDSECSFGISKYIPKGNRNKTYKILLQCNNTKISTIIWLYERFGGSCYFVPRKSKNILHKDQIAWRISSNALSSILPKIQPYLRTKQIICNKLIEFYSTTQPRYGNNKKEAKEAYFYILKKRDVIADQIHSLNSKVPKVI